MLNTLSSVEEYTIYIIITLSLGSLVIDHVIKRTI